MSTPVTAEATLSTPDLEPTAPPRLPFGGSPGDELRLAMANQVTWRLLDERRRNPDASTASRGYQRLSDAKVSTTDPDATPMRRFPGDAPKLGYRDHYVVDGGKARIILWALITPADVMENTPMVDLYQRVCFRWQLRPKRAAGAREALSRHRGISEGAAQTRRVGGTALRRGQTVARLALLPVAGPLEGELRRLTDSGGTKPKAMAQQDRMGAPIWTGGEPDPLPFGALPGLRHWSPVTGPTHPPSFSTACDLPTATD